MSLARWVGSMSVGTRFDDHHPSYERVERHVVHRGVGRVPHLQGTAKGRIPRPVAQANLCKGDRYVVSFARTKQRDSVRVASLTGHRSEATVELV